MFKHLKEKNLSYIEHFTQAVGYFLVIQKAAICVLLHAIFPDLFPTTASKAIKNLAKKFEQQFLLWWLDLMKLLCSLQLQNHHIVSGNCRSPCNGNACHSNVFGEAPGPCSDFASTVRRFWRASQDLCHVLERKPV